MKIIPIVLAAGLVLGASGCATTATEDLPNIPDASENTSGNGGEIVTPANPDETNSDGSFNITRGLDPFQPQRLLGEVEVSISKATAEGFVETITFPGDPVPSIIAYDPSRPAGEMGALIIDTEFAIPAPAENAEELMSGFLEIRGEATAMVSLIETGAEGAGDYVNIITNDGFIFNSTGTGYRVHVVTDENDIIQSFTSTTPDGNLVYKFQYGLTQQDKDLIESAYAFEDSEIVYD